MEEDFEEFDDLIDAFPAVVFTKNASMDRDILLEILAGLDIERQVVSVSESLDLERMVLANSKGFSFPVLFLNGNVFSDAATFLRVSATGELAGYLDQVGVAYNAEFAAAFAAANQ